MRAVRGHVLAVGAAEKLVETVAGWQEWRVIAHLPGLRRRFVVYPEGPELITVDGDLDHLEIGTGIVPFEEVAAALQDIGYSHGVTLELNPYRVTPVGQRLRPFTPSNRLSRGRTPLCLYSTHWSTPQRRSPCRLCC